MGETLSTISPSPCCGADYPTDRELNTQSAHEVYYDSYETNKSNRNDTEQPKLYNNEYDEWMEERNKYKLQTSRLQQQLDQYKVQEQKQIQEFNEYKQQNIKLTDTKNELLHTTTQLTAIIDEYKQSETNKTDIETTHSYAEIVKLTNDINNTQTDNMDEEVKSLNNKLQLLMRQLEAQQTENDLLKLRLDQQSDNSIQTNTETVIQKQFSPSLEEPLPTEPICTDKSDIHDHMEVLVQNQSGRDIQEHFTPTPTSTDTVDIDIHTIPASNYLEERKALHTVKSADKIQSVQRLESTLESASSAKDVKELRGFILKQYKTVRFEDDDLSEDDDFEVQEEHEDRESSLEPEEEIAIAQAKAEQIREKDMEDEVVAMKKEMRELKKLDVKAMKQEMTAMQQVMSPDVVKNKKKRDYILQKQRTDSMEDSMSRSEEHSLEHMTSNLYRAGSAYTWDTETVVKEKMEMQAAMEALVQSHLQSNTVLSDYLSD